MSSSCCGKWRSRSRTANVPDAQKTLRQAQQALQDALARDAPDAEIQKLMP